MTEWKPIETAPEGMVLLWARDCGHLGDYRMTIGFRSPHPGVTITGRGRNAAADKVEWLSIESENKSVYDDGPGPIEIVPTHWMPLPEPPKC